MGRKAPAGNASFGSARGTFLSRDSTDGVHDTPMELGAGLSEAQGRLYLLSQAQMATTSCQASTGVACAGSKGQKAELDTRDISPLLLC